MSFTPTLTERLARARTDLRMGFPVLLEGEYPIVFCAAETLGPDRFDVFRKIGGNPVVAVTSRRAETLKAHAYDGDVARIEIPPAATLEWVHSLADPAKDLALPMKGPLHCLREGNPALYRIAIDLAKASRLLPAVVCVALEKKSSFTQEHDLVRLPGLETAEILKTRSVLHQAVSAHLPIEVSEKGRLHVFRPEDGGEEHYAIEVGKPTRSEPVLTRLHSACLTGDLLGSLKCDCGPQLRAALQKMGQEGSGVLLYMNQEGRGIGLTNKMRAYSLQDQGFDTVEANHRLGFEDDERDFRLGADILSAMGFRRVRLLTNNPRKVDMMEASGIKVMERVPLHVGENRYNSKYLATKVAKSGHLK